VRPWESLKIEEVSGKLGTLSRWLRYRRWLGSIPSAIVALASASVVCQTVGEALGSGRRHGMPRTRTAGTMTLMRRTLSAVLMVSAGVGGNLIASLVPASI
jgi:hypothetical protein